MTIIRSRSRGPRWRALIVTAAWLVGMQGIGPVAADEGEFRLARLSATAVPLGTVPDGPSEADLARYRQIFALQRAGDWAAADALMTQLGNQLLLGHVLAQRYLHPTAYRSSYGELAAWLERYADLPQAPRLYHMALKRRPEDVPPPIQPGSTAARDAGEAAVSTGRIGGRKGPWRDGLAAWRRGDMASAALAFGELANHASLDGEDLAAAAFWAARASIRARQPQLVTRYLRLAAGSDGFYGLLGRRMLDAQVDVERQPRASVETSVLELLLRYPAAQRAVALGRIGEAEAAEAEVRGLAGKTSPELQLALVALASNLDLLPSTQLGSLADQGRLADIGDRRAFPVPRWKPVRGYTLEPALIYAVVRAESGFDPDARSAKGALGLMQVLPDTAAMIARSIKVAYQGEDWLLKPENNLLIGQSWLERLARTKTVGGSLIHLITAYNAGEARLAAWLQDDLKGTDDDPLLFIESVPLAETRGYIKKVLGNLWAYQVRLDKPSPSLQALAENRWPHVAMVKVGTVPKEVQVDARAD